VNYTLSNNSLNMNNTGGVGNAAISSSSGTQTINSSVVTTVASDLDVSVSGGTLNLAGGINNTAAKVVNLANTGGTLTIGAITNNGTLNANGNATIGKVTGIGSTSIATGKTLTIATNGASSNVSVQTSLSIAGGLVPTATLEMNDNDLVIKGGTPYATIEAQVKSAYNNGLWTGQGIRSTPAIAAGNTGLAVESGTDYNIVGTTPGSFDGQTIVAADVIVKYTYLGDITLDGAVDDADLFAFLPAYTGSQTGNWSQGDFTHDGLVDDADLFAFLPNYVGGASGLAGTAVPEPASLVIRNR
jgi:hypothetical protein